jgi:6,7-dimethyl-8-ribityllumazine synthase
MSTQSQHLLDTTGIRLPANAFVIIIRTTWNASILDELEAGCTRILQQHGVSFEVVTVPGAFEIPFAAKKCYEKAADKPMAIITLGCVLRGDTPHFEYVCKAVTDGVLQLNLMLPVPVIFGVLTINNEQQALERLGGLHGHKGEEAAITAIKMMVL